MGRTARSVVIAVAGFAMITLANTRAQAQETAPAQEEFLQTEVKPAEWHTVARSTTRVYLLDANSIGESGGVSQVSIARVPKTVDSASDLSHSLDTFEIRCRSSETRTVMAFEMGPDGVETDRYDDQSDWDRINPGSLDETIKDYVCDGKRGTAATFPSIAAYIAAGRN